MKKLLLLILSLLVVTTFSFTIFDDFKSVLSDKLKDYTENNYPEKIYIHTDKPYYSAGESIWLSTYLVNGVSHRPSEKSTVVYLELIDKLDSIVDKKMLFIEDISTNANFDLPVDLEEGDYTIRAFTKYNLNQSNTYIFTKNISIFNPFADKAAESIIKTNTLKNTPELGLYPEGGYLVEGIENKVAVKIEGQNLDAKKIPIRIENDLGEKVAECFTKELGLGVFKIKPVAGRSYNAVIELEDENISFAVPVALKKGYVVNVKEEEKFLKIELATNTENGLKNSLLIGHQRGKEMFTYYHSDDTNFATVKIPKFELGAGVINITLFDEAHNPIADRLLYMNIDDGMVATIKTDEDIVSTNQKVNVALQVNNEYGDFIPSTLSMTVIDNEAISVDENQENIKTYLLLNSDLKGKITAPNYYFTKGDKVKKDSLLDLTMMTQGWSRFTWQEILSDTIATRVEPEVGISIQGNTISTEHPYMHKKTYTRLTFKYDGVFQKKKETDENGVFSYGPFVYNDSIDVIMEASDEAFVSVSNQDYGNTAINVRPVQSINPPIIKNRILEPIDLPLAVAKTYESKTKKIINTKYAFDDGREMLGEVFLKGEVKTQEEIENVERNKRTRHLTPSHRIVVSELGEAGDANFLAIVRNIPGVVVSGVLENVYNRVKPADESVSIDPDKPRYDNAPVLIRGQEPSYYLDNVKVDLQTLATIPPADIDFVDVLKGSSTVAYSLKATGIIAVFTKQGSRDMIIDKKNTRPGTKYFRHPGFYTAKEFYAPDYSKETTSIGNEDIRTTLHWEPLINTNITNSEEISFYTCDLKGRYLIQVEGVTTSGKPIYTEKLIYVE